MKLHIIGCSGTGKSYLAFYFQKYHIPHYNLDDIQWANNTGGYGIKRDEVERDALLRGLSKVLTMHGYRDAFMTLIKYMF